MMKGLGNSLHLAIQCPTITSITSAAQCAWILPGSTRSEKVQKPQDQALNVWSSMEFLSAMIVKEIIYLKEIVFESMMGTYGNISLWNLKDQPFLNTVILLRKH